MGSTILWLYVSIHFRRKTFAGTTFGPPSQYSSTGPKSIGRGFTNVYTTYLKTERGQRELSFLMALRICQFYKMDLHEFVAMLSDEELGRNELPIIRALEKRERKKAELLKAKVIEIKTEQAAHPTLL